MAKITIIYVNYNCGDLIAASIDTVLRGTLPPEKIIVVDNGSSDGSSERVEKASSPGLCLIRSSENIGFGAGCNIGFDKIVKDGDCDFALLMNPDTLVSADCLKRMSETMETHEKIGALGARLLDEKGGCVYDGGVRLADRRFDHLHQWPGDAPGKCDWITGACLMVRRSLLEQGLRFEHRYFLYSEDIDFSLRVQKKGKETWHDPGATVIHEMQFRPDFISPMRCYYYHRSKFLLAAFHGDTVLWDVEKKQLRQEVFRHYKGVAGLKHIIAQLIDLRYGWQERAMIKAYLDAKKGKTGKVDYRFFQWANLKIPFKPFRISLK